MGDDGKDQMTEYLKMMMDKNWPMLRAFGNIQGIADRENVILSEGPGHGTIDQRREQWGKNELPEPEEQTFWDMILDGLGDKMMQVLCLAAAISLTLGLTVPDPHTGKVNYAEGWIDGAAILTSVVIVTLVTATNEWSKAEKFKELSQAKPPVKCWVRRGGSKCEIMSTDLVQGDLVYINTGDEMPADALYVEGQDLKIDESSVTGENIELSKDCDQDPFLISGSSVIEGDGLALVVGVGENSMRGKAEMKNREEKAPTPLQEKLDELVEQISWGGAGFAALTFIALVSQELYKLHEAGTLGYDTVVTMNMGSKILEALTVAVTIIVVAVPEGLPLSVTIALAYSMNEMMKEKNLVRHLQACETMGGATQICSDKTGTLTQNRMTVVRAVFHGDETAGRPRKIVVPEHIEYRSSLSALRQKFSFDFLEAFTHGLVLNSVAYRGEDKDREGNMISILKGNKTECAMLELLEGMGDGTAGKRDPIDKELIARLRQKLGYEKTKERHDRHTYPFSSAKKRMTTLHRHGDNMRVLVKGASEMVLQDCTKIMSIQGKIEDLDDLRRTQMKENIADMARQALRTLAIAIAERPGQGRAPFDSECPDHEKLTLLAILAIEDPLRQEVPEAVALCKKAGITVRMVTGDNKATAIAIAKEAGIYDPSNGIDLAMEGKDFREFAGDDPASKEKMTYVLHKLKVLARMTPLDKQILVESLRSRGEIVAVTGDGTNDAPALKLANVGFAMMTGTEVAKSASDIILMDDNFRSVVTAAKWGRNINDNIRKFIQFQMTVNVAAVLIAFLGSVFSDKGESPLKPVQLLWLNLIMDSMAALALATEEPYIGLLERPPNFAGLPLISRRMWVFILGQSSYQIALQLWLLYEGHAYFGVEQDSDEHMTVIFNIFVLLQVVNEFNARELRDGKNPFAGLHRAKWFCLIIIITTLVQFAAIEMIPGFFGCVPLTLEQWKKCWHFSLVPLPLGLLIRFIPVVEPPPEKIEVPTWISQWRRTRRLFDRDLSKAGEGRGKAAFKAATKEIIQQMKVSGALATLRRRRPRTASTYQAPSARH